MITPFSFDPETARGIVGDAMAREIETKARQDAEVEHFGPPTPGAGSTWWDQCCNEMRTVVYHEQYMKRRARIIRKRGKNETANQSFA